MAGKSKITLEDVDPGCVELLSSFREGVLARFGSMKKAFEHWDEDGSRQLDRAEFCAAVHDLGTFVGNEKKLFTYLDEDMSGALSNRQLTSLKMTDPQMTSRQMMHQMTSRQMTDHQMTSFCQSKWCLF